MLLRERVGRKENKEWLQSLLQFSISRNAERVGKFQPRPGSPRGQPAWGGSVCFETLGSRAEIKFSRNSERVATVLRSFNRDATLSELRRSLN
jgi:hypothetical protein